MVMMRSRVRLPLVAYFYALHCKKEVRLYMQVYLLMYKTNFFFIGWNTHTELKRSGNEVAVQALAFRDNRAVRRGALRLLFIGWNTHTELKHSGNEVAVQALAFRDNRAVRRGALRLLFIGWNTHTELKHSGNEVAVQALAFRDNRAARRGALRHSVLNFFRIL